MYIHRNSIHYQLLSGLSKFLRKELGDEVDEKDDNGSNRTALHFSVPPKKTSNIQPRTTTAERDPELIFLTSDWRTRIAN